MPVEVFGTDSCCEHGEHTDCPSTGYGLSDAVMAWSDCNRAEGHIYRFDDLDREHREDGETLSVWVDPDEYRAFSARVWGGTDEIEERWRRKIEALIANQDGCVVDSCGDPVEYAGAYRLGDRKIILSFCERHFDESNDHALDFDR